MISIKGLNKYFNKGRQNEIHVINDVTLTLPDKGMVAIFGKSGCGKTTLLNVIGGLDSFAGGEVSIDGLDISKNTDDIRNRYIGYIFQNYNLSKGVSCFDNVAAALRLCGENDEEEIKRRVAAALCGVGMENYAMRPPETLSGGQQQRIAIARAIVKNPRIILADEPTGNLDEANTVMIMDLLKAISREHLVLLVTHEANLVDYYCDTVIELSDGRVVSERKNASANGFAARDKNDIYLGELEKSQIADTNADVEYYGDAPASPVKLKIINTGGKLYVRIDTPGAQILDDTSEVRLREGSYEDLRKSSESSQRLDMSQLPPIKAKRTGRLFSLRSSIKSGYTSNFKKRKRGKKLLKRCMGLFASVIVLMSAVFGTAFKDIAKADSSYNHNVFYLYTPSGEVSQKLLSSVGDEDSGIDYVSLISGYPTGDSYVSFNTGSFETFSQGIILSMFGTNAVYLGSSLAEKLPLLHGKNTGLLSDEIVITSAVADALLEKSSLGYIKDRDDLIGLFGATYYTDGKIPKIVGIVESDESAVYLNELSLAKRVNAFLFSHFVILGSDYGIELDSGEALLAISNLREGVTYPDLNESIKINGVNVKVTEKMNRIAKYNLWLSEKGISKSENAHEYFYNIVKAENPDIQETSKEFIALVEKTYNERYCEFYDYYYSEFKDYCKNLLLFEQSNFDLWLYVEKDVEVAKFITMPEEYYTAHVYKSIHGKYPTKTELDGMNYFVSYKESLLKYYEMYETEFYSRPMVSAIYSSVYFVSDEDYIAMSKRLGETHPSAKEDYYIYYDVGTGAEVAPSKALTAYTVIHSKDPERTSEWLSSSFSDLEAPDKYREAMITPDDILSSIKNESYSSILSNLVTMGIIIAVMSLCMYFIMRSSLMNRIKEVGILRAIGVSRKNLIFKFFVEAGVLATLTIFTGYLISSAFVFVCTGTSALMQGIFYYPVWLALSVLILLFSITVFFGTLPIMLLLRKTPSQILSKYDI